MNRVSRVLLVLLSCTSVLEAEPPRDLQQPTRAYYAYVCSESDDVVTLVRYGPQGLERVKEISVGSFPAEIEGPHGIAVAPGGGEWYVSIAHGFPFGSVHKYQTGSDEWLGDVVVGMFPATMAIAPSTGLLYVVNFDLHGDPRPSSVSVVETSSMTEVAQVETGIMPHGSRLTRLGDRHYSVSMMDDELVELDALRFEVRRRLALGPGDHCDTGGRPVKPTWVTSPTEEGLAYVAGNGSDVILEVDLEEWRVTRRLSGAGRGPYNLAIAPDSDLLVVTYKGGNTVGFWRLSSGEEMAELESTRRLPHGVAVTSDGRFSFVTVEGVGSEPGSVEVYDNGSFARVGVLDVGKQAGGIALWEGPSSP